MKPFKTTLLPMKTYKIITTCDAISEYTVLAETEAEAQEKFLDGEFETEEITDYRNETIDSIDVI